MATRNNSTSARKSRLAGAITRFVETHEGEVPPPVVEDTSLVDTSALEQEGQDMQPPSPPVRKPRSPKSEEQERAEAMEQAILQLRAAHFRWAARQVGDDSANDAFQEVWLRAMAKAQEIRQPQEWMLACLRRVLQEMQDPAHRRELREVHGVDLDATPQEEPEEQDGGADKLTALLDVVNLPETQRRAFVMRREGYALRVIAAELGVSYGAAEMLVGRATAALKQHMQASRVMLQGVTGE